jgi:hypothetical protein
VDDTIDLAELLDFRAHLILPALLA